MKHSWTLGLMIAALAACSQEKEPEVQAPSPPTYRGPQFLYGTIASVSRIEGFEDLVVRGYGVVVDLNGTGSPDCPPALQPKIMDMMRKGGFGSIALGMGDRTPKVELNSGRVAVVRVEGVIPAGAVKGSRFDLQVSALPDSYATSLEGGKLYSTDLQIGEINPAESGFVLATGKGPIFINPFLDPELPPQEIDDPRRIGQVFAGGVAQQDLPLRLVLPRPSLRLVETIADRINAQFPTDPTDSQPAATLLDESNIRIHVLNRFRDDPRRMLDLIGHVYLNPTPLAAKANAGALVKILADPANEKYADDIALTWEAMGKISLPVIREHYESPNAVLRMAALTAGAGLGDARTLEPIQQITREASGPRVEQATVLLGRLLQKHSGDGRLAAAIRPLMGHEDPLTRIAAYNALARDDDPSIQRFAFDEKVEISHVQCESPMIYASREGVPRIIIFGETLGFRAPMRFAMWDNHFMLQTDESDPSKVRMFFQDPTRSQPVTQELPGNVMRVAGFLAYQPKPGARTDGLDFTYNRIVSILHRMTQSGDIPAPMYIQKDTLAERIERLRIAQPPATRPDTTDPAEAAAADPAP